MPKDVISDGVDLSKVIFEKHAEPGQMETRKKIHREYLMFHTV
jgi:hypothetical protein